MAAFFIIDEDLQEERRQRRYNLRQNFRLASIPDVEFIGNYRLTRELFEELCADLIPLLPQHIRRSGVDPQMKILAVLNFYARGSYQGSVGLSSDVPMAQQTVSRCLRHVTNALNSPSILQKYIKFPQNLAVRNLTKRQFYDKCGLPGVVGCIDCTHVALVKPSEHEERFFNRKHFHSLNVQAICNAECTILNVDASYGGASHDSFIWSHHEIKAHLESLQQETVCLLGDSGYPLRKFMMTPIDNAVEDSPEGRYNYLQKRARSTIERTFGILKGRWRCLLAARELHYAPTTAGKIVIACCVLHNMCNRAGLEAPPLSEEDLELERIRQGDVFTSTAMSSHRALQQGQRARDTLVQLLERNRT